MLTRSSISKPAPRRGRPPVQGLTERRREQILDAAVRVFARHGFAGADVQQVADRIGVGKGTIYRYFSTKEVLFLAAADRVMRLLRAEVDNARRPIDEGDPLDQITRAVTAYLRFFDEHPEYVELLIHERASFRDRKKPTYFEHRETNSARWQEWYGRLMSEGRIRRMPVERITLVLGNTLYGTMFTNFFAGRGKSYHEQAADILDVTFHGIVNPSGRRAGPGGGEQGVDR